MYILLPRPTGMCPVLSPMVTQLTTPRSGVVLLTSKLWGRLISMRSNPIALAMLNYVQTVDSVFGLSDPHATIEPTESEADNG